MKQTNKIEYLLLLLILSFVTCCFIGCQSETLWSKGIFQTGMLLHVIGIISLTFKLSYK